MTGVSDALSGGERVRWWLGWHGRFATGGGLVLGAILGIATNPASFFLVVIAAVGLWYEGVRTVNRSYRTVVEAFDDRVTDAVRSQYPSADVERIDALWYGRGQSRLLEPFRVYRNTVLVFTPETLVVHADAELLLPRLESRIGQSTERIGYDDISEVSYDAVNHTLVIERDNGQRTTYPTHDDASPVVEVLDRVSRS